MLYVCTAVILILLLNILLIKRQVTLRNIKLSFTATGEIKSDSQTDKKLYMGHKPDSAWSDCGWIRKPNPRI